MQHLGDLPDTPRFSPSAYFAATSASASRERRGTEMMLKLSALVAVGVALEK
jgi:hypothetical protein